MDLLKTEADRHLQSGNSPFLLARSGGELLYFDELAAAVSEAASGEVVEIRLDGAHLFEMIDIGEKDLVLRAAPGYQPEFYVSGTTAPAIESRGRLWLDGLSFERDSAEGVDYPIVRANGPLLWIANCRLTIDSGGEVTAPPTGLYRDRRPARNSYCSIPWF